MKKQLPAKVVFLFFISFLLGFEKISGQMSLRIEAPCISNSIIKLGYYYCDRTYLKDTLRVDAKGQLFYQDTFKEGLYFILLPGDSAYEFMATGGNNYLITISKRANNYLIDLKSNPVAEGYAAYNIEFSRILHSLDSLKYLEISTTDKAVVDEMKKSIEHQYEMLDLLRSQYRFTFKGTLLESYLLALTPVELKNMYMSSQSKGSDPAHFIDQLKYYQEHFLDNVSLNDERLIYTPVMAEKVNLYLTEIIQHKPVPLMSAIDSLLKKIENKEVSRFVLEDLIEKYGSNTKNPVDEYVYAHLIENYYIAGKASWLTNDQLQLFENELIRIKPAIIQQTAPGIELRGQDYKVHALQKMNSDYTLLVFWNFDNALCKRVLQELINCLEKYDNIGIAVYTVCNVKNLEAWINFVNAKLPVTWTNTYEMENHPVADKYNISLVPAIFILDKEKKIIDKNITVPGVDSFLLKVTKKDK